MKTTVIFALSFLSLSAFADYNLSKKPSAIVCYGADNQSFDLNAARTMLKYTVEGESNGPKKITKTITDNNTYVSYKTSEGVLVLSKTGDTFKFTDAEEAEEVDCRIN